MRETSEEGRGEKFRMSLVIGSYCYQLQEMLLKVTLMRNRYLCNTLLRSCVPAFLRSCVPAFLRFCAFESIGNMQRRKQWARTLSPLPSNRASFSAKFRCGKKVVLS
jgi:hypothetical protein